MKTGKLNIYFDFILLLILTLATIIVFRSWSQSVFLVGKIVVEEGEALDLCRLILLNIGRENYVRTGEITQGYEKEMHFLNLRVCADCPDFDENEMHSYLFCGFRDIDCEKKYMSEHKCPFENCFNMGDTDDDGIPDEGDDDSDGEFDEFYPKTDCGYGQCYISCEWFNDMMETSYPGLGQSVKMLNFEVKGEGEETFTSPEHGPTHTCPDEGPDNCHEYKCKDVCPTGDFVVCDITLYGTKETGKLTICALK